MLATKTYLAQFKDWEKEARTRASVEIMHTLVEAGVIQLGQQEVGPEKIESAFKAAYLPELLRQEQKSSTGGAGKFADVANRCLMRIAREQAMPIADLRCRPASCPDIYVYPDGEDLTSHNIVNGRSRVAVEMKTGAGQLAIASELAESWFILSRAIETGKMIVWYPFGIQGWQGGELEVVDDMPYFFGTYDQLFDKLAGYNGDIKTWLKVCGNCVNFQNVTSSGKKMAFLEELCQSGWDWPLFRDWGRIREK